MARALLLLASISSACVSLDNHRRHLGAVEVRPDLAYLPDGHPRHALDVVVPRTPREGGAPVVLFIHGGYWHAQDRRYLQPIVGLYSNVGVALAAEGIVGVVTSYRLFPEVRIEEQLADVRAALEWVVAHAAEHGGDPTKIVLAGHSAGAHLATMLATSDAGAHARGVVALSGAYDVPGLIEHGLDREMIEQVVIPHFHGEAARRSPLAQMSAAMPPTWFVVGERDYPRCLADFFAARAQLRGRAFEFTMLERRTHADVVLEIGSKKDVLTPRIARFVRRVTARR